MTTEQLIEILGLAPDADTDDIDAEIRRLKESDRILKQVIQYAQQHQPAAVKRHCSWDKGEGDE